MQMRRAVLAIYSFSHLSGHDIYQSLLNRHSIRHTHYRVLGEILCVEKGKVRL